MARIVCAVDIPAAAAALLLIICRRVNIAPPRLGRGILSWIVEQCNEWRPITTRRHDRSLLIATAVAIAALLAGCGGSSGDSSPAPPPADPNAPVSGSLR